MPPTHPGPDRMAKDTALTVAQMQGKFQMAFIRGVGHSIQENAPEKMCRALQDFAARVAARRAYAAATASAGQQLRVKAPTVVA